MTMTMTLAMTDEQRAELEGAVRTSRNVRHWKRYQAVLLRAAGTPVAVVAKTLGCSEDSVTNWTKAWQAGGLVGVREGPHRGATRRLDPAAERRLEEVLEEGDPQVHGYAATGWTASARTLRRTLHRLGWVWKRPKFVLGRPDLAYTQKKGR